MHRAYKLKLKPTKEQEKYLFKASNVARYTYNWALDRWTTQYEETKKNVSAYKLITVFNKFKKEKGNEWILEVSQKIPTRAIMDLEEAFTLFFKGESKYPRFHSYRKTKPSFFVRPEGMTFTNSKVKLEKLGYVKYSGTVDTSKKFYNPRAKYDGKNWYLTINYEVVPDELDALEKNVIGIDIGVNNLAILSNGKVYPNINKSKEIIRLGKKRARLSRSQNRKYKMNNKPNEFVKTKNNVKMEQEIKNIFIKMRNIRVDYINKVVADIVKHKPTTIVMENIAIKNLSKNKHLKNSIEDSLWGYFIQTMKSKCDLLGIEFVQVDRFYPSSKKCSSCGNVKKKLALSERVYTCNECGYVEDRDLNASINLKNYALGK